MWEFLKNLFTSSYMPHGYCYLWQPGLVWLHVISDGLITLSYYTIPIVLVYFVRRRRTVPFNWMFLMFAIFIFGCGTTHLMGIWTVWHGAYWLSGGVKLITAGASVATAAMLVPLVPKALALPSTEDLASANRALQNQVEERLHAEQALRESENRLHAIMESSPAIIFIKDVEGRYVYANPPFRKLCDVSRTDIVGMKDHDLFSPEQAELFHANDLKVLQSGRPFEFEEVAMQEDGPHASIVLKFPLRDSAGKIYSTCGIVTDITERKRAEEKFRALLESAPDAMVIMDGQGLIVLVNTQAEKLFGFKREELIGQPVEILVPERLRASHVGYRARFTSAATEQSGRSVLELMGKRKNGSEFPTEISLSPLRTPQGLLISSAIRDTTERQEAQIALQKLSGDLLRLQDEERRRIARELHDGLGQSVVSVLMDLSIVENSGVVLSQRARKAFSEACSTMQDCADSLRTLSYLLHPPMLDELGLTSALKQFTAGFAERSGIRVGVSTAEGFSRLPRATELCLFRVAQEALMNIHRHSESPTARIRITRQANQIILEIQDEGIGIPDLPEFQAGDRMPKDAGVGMMGMRERVRALGGRLEILAARPGTLVRAVMPFTAEA